MSMVSYRVTLDLTFASPLKTDLGYKKVGGIFVAASVHKVNSRY